jgi:hypothetical protein
MTTKWVRATALALGLTFFTVAGASANTERWPGTKASIGGAIAARIIAVKCSGPLTPAEIAELDTYIDERQTAFMSASKANQRLGETLFPQLARDYNQSYSNREACDFAARDMVRDMLARVRAEQAELKKQAELKQ